MSTEDESRKILIPIDNNDHSRRAVHWYLNDFEKPNDELLFFHVVEPSIRRGSTAVDSAKLEWTSTKSIQLDQLLGQQQIDMLKRHKVKSNFKVEFGFKTGDVIVAEAKDSKADVVIIGSRGMSKFRRTVWGSVSDYVLHNVNLPVVIVPPAEA